MKVLTIIPAKLDSTRLEKKNLTKDGIHMIIGIQTDRITQEILRSRIIEKLPEILSEKLLD